MTLPVPWEVCAVHFERDGALRDIYVLNANLATWDAALKWIRSEFRGELTRDGEPVEWFSDVGHFFGGEAVLKLSFYVGDIDLACHFFTVDEIELDFVPNTLDATKLEGLIEFMRGLARCTGKQAVMTPENCEHTPIFRVQPNGVAEYVLPAAREL